MFAMSERTGSGLFDTFSQFIHHPFVDRHLYDRVQDLSVSDQLAINWNKRRNLAYVTVLWQNPEEVELSPYVHFVKLRPGQFTTNSSPDSPRQFSLRQHQLLQDLTTLGLSVNDDVSFLIHPRFDFYLTPDNRLSLTNSGPSDLEVTANYYAAAEPDRPASLTLAPEHSHQFPGYKRVSVLFPYDQNHSVMVHLCAAGTPSQRQTLLSYSPC